MVKEPPPIRIKVNAVDNILSSGHRLQVMEETILGIHKPQPSPLGYRLLGRRYNVKEASDTMVIDGYGA